MKLPNIGRGPLAFHLREWSPPLIAGDFCARDFLASTSLSRTCIGITDVIDVIYPASGGIAVGG